MKQAVTDFAVFRHEGTFRAMYAAEEALERHGFSVGHNQRGEPRGILRGDYDIQKWRNLDRQDRNDLHGWMTGDMREGPVQVEFFASAPADKVRAFMTDVAKGALALADDRATPAPAEGDGR